MKHIFCKRNILFSIVILCSFSCTSDLDFDQVNDFNAQPVVTTNLAYFERKAPDFVVNGIDLPPFAYVANVDFFNRTFVEDDLVKAELYFRIKNTIKRSYTFKSTFLDANNAPIYTTTMNVPIYNGSEILVEKTETFTAANVDILKRTTKMVFSVEMNPGPPLTETSPGRI